LPSREPSRDGRETGERGLAALAYAWRLVPTRPRARGDDGLLCCGRQGGLDWLVVLAKDGRGIDLGGNGCPSRFTAQSEQLRTYVDSGPPNANPVWVTGVDDVIDHDKWLGRATIDKHAL